MESVLAPGLGLEVGGLRVTLGGRPVLDLPHLVVPRGTALAIRGPSGAGKSTLLLALAGLFESVCGIVCCGFYF